MVLCANAKNAIPYTKAAIVRIARSSVKILAVGQSGKEKRHMQRNR